jgi:hypothetical protein
MGDDGPRRENTSIQPGSDSLAMRHIRVLEPTVWQSGQFARRWFEDAARDAAVGGGDARRREIIFAVCFAESYLLEWTRDEVLQRDFNALQRYFAVDKRQARRARGVADKWKDVPKRLKSDGRIREHPDYGKQVWNDFRALIDSRDGLIHARASLPHHSATPKAAMPEPTADLLNQMQPGWPTGVVVALIGELHAKAGTALPAWLRVP